MSMFVLDNSMSMCWCFDDQRTPYTEAVLRSLDAGCAVVPDLWFLEVANVTAFAEQRGLLAKEERTRLVGFLEGLRKQVDRAESTIVLGAVIDLAVKHRLTAYDARYLELAKRMRLPLATLDHDLKAAAKKEKVEMFAPA